MTSVEPENDSYEKNSCCLPLYPPVPKGITQRNKMAWIDFGGRLVFNWPMNLLSVFGSNAQIKYYRRTFHCVLLANATGEDEHMRTTVSTFAGVPVRIHEPINRRGNGGMLYIHGGGFVVGSPRTFDNVTRSICKETGIVLVSIDYRLSPKHTYPSALVDCERAAVHFLTTAHKEYGVDPGKVVIIGDSAGGNLAAVIIQRLRKSDIPQPKLQILIYPWMQMVDFQLPSYQMMAKYSKTSLLTAGMLARFTLHYLLGSREIGHFIPDLVANRHLTPHFRQSSQFSHIHPNLSSKSPSSTESSMHGISNHPNPELCNLLHPYLSDPDVNPLIRPHLEGLPKTMLITVQFDPLKDEGILYVERLRSAGVPVQHRHYEGGFHGVLGYNKSQISRHMIKDIAAFVIENMH